MDLQQFFLPLTGGLFLIIGIIVGYYTRQSVAQKQAETLEAKIKKKINQLREDGERIISEAKEKARRTLEAVRREEEERRANLLKTEQILLKKETILEEKSQLLEKKEEEFHQKVEELRKIKSSLEEAKSKAIEKLEKISRLSKSEAKKELFENLEKDYQKEILERIKKVENEGWERYEKKAKEILALAIQRCAISQAQELTTTTVILPNEEIKGRIIGKEGRNIRTLEKLTGVEFIIDEAPEAVVISSFDPLRRQIAKTALEKLIQDGRIQPARIEEITNRAQEEIASKIKEVGEAAVYEAGIIGLDPKLIHLLGRLHFRTSYGQNVLLHSLEVAYLAATLASEIGADVQTCKKAGLLHDVGKSVDHQIEGSHTEIGIKILEKFGVEKKVIDAMKSHHEEYPYETLEAIVVQVADQISGARPGARKDTVENYLKRLSDLENIATSFPGVEKAWALQAGREIRVFIKPEEVDDLGAQKLAKEIANQIEEELKYPGEIKVTVIREIRAIEYAK